eukprot:11773739-Alexandrium_andersonii.AAC.1
MDEAAVPTGPAGRKVLVQGLKSARNEDPSVAALGAGVAARCDARGTQRRNIRVPAVRRCQAMATE